jgi:hypothetical protein
MMSVNCACVAVMNRQSKSTADRTVLEALCLRAFEDLIHKYSSKMHKILAQKLYSSYCINYTSFPEPLNSLYPSIFNGFTLLHHIPELHQ